MATRNVTYQFADGNLATYDRNTEMDAINTIETNGLYVKKWDVSIPEREYIDDPDTGVHVVDNDLILITTDGVVVV